MKRLTLFVVMLLLVGAAAMAQNNKKVAILETVDKEGNVPYGVRLQLRSMLTYAISSTDGYEGYDRVDMSSIMGEQNFQRTGMVSDAQIKKLGEMTGASSILVAEAAIYDASHIIITAKILGVESAGVEAAAPPKVSSTSPEDMEKACTELARKLLGNTVNNGGNTSTPIVSERTPSQNQDYVDLGLPSGTLWKKTNESEKLDYNSAFSKYGQKMPSRDHIVELNTYCTLEWTGNGYKVTGKNGNYIFLPATEFGEHVRDGIGGFYWLYSSVAKNSGVAPIIYFGPNSRLRIGSSLIDTSNTNTIRLIKEP